MPAEITRANLAQSLGMGRKRKVTRHLNLPKDRWNRMYTVWIDAYSHQPVGLIEYNFRAPFNVPQRYCRVPTNAPWRMELDLVSYARELQANMQDWEREVKEHGRKLYSDRWDVVLKEGGGRIPPDVLARTGPRPLSHHLPILLLEGDPFLLGFTAKPTRAVRAADPHFVRDYEEKRAAAIRARKQSVENPRKQAVPLDLQLPAELATLVEVGGAVRDNLYEDEEDALRAAHERRMALEKAKQEEEAPLTGENAEDEGDEEEEDDGTAFNSAGVRVNAAGEPVETDEDDMDEDLSLTDEELNTL